MKAAQNMDTYPFTIIYFPDTIKNKLFHKVTQGHDEAQEKLCDSGYISHVETYQGCVSSSHNAEAKPWMPLGYFYNHLLAGDNGTRGRIHWQRSLETTWRRSENGVTGRQKAKLCSHTCRGHTLHVLILSLFFCQAPQRKRLGHSCPFTQRGNMTFLWHFWDESNN